MPTGYVTILHEAVTYEMTFGLYGVAAMKVLLWRLMLPNAARW